jgi:hypothetical protein
MSVSFDVEEAGCESCARIIGSALGRLASVESIEIDEDADRARVVLAGDVPWDAVKQRWRKPPRDPGTPIACGPAPGVPAGTARRPPPPELLRAASRA